MVVWFALWLELVSIVVQCRVLSKVSINRVKGSVFDWSICAYSCALSLIVESAFWITRHNWPHLTILSRLISKLWESKSTSAFCWSDRHWPAYIRRHSKNISLQQPGSTVWLLRATIRGGGGERRPAISWAWHQRLFQPGSVRRRPEHPDTVSSASILSHFDVKLQQCQQYLYHNLRRPRNQVARISRSR